MLGWSLHNRQGIVSIAFILHTISYTFRNRQATLDKYCLRGAEWGVGDCSADGMSLEDREKFISMLKKKAGIE